MKTFLSITVLLLIAFCSYAGGGDTTKIKYDINDPRNPECPCHKYQQLANEEYQQLLTNKSIQQASGNIAEQIIQTRTGTASVLTTLAAGEAFAKSKKDSDKLAGTKKINRGVFSKRSGSKRQSHTPKKRKVRFGRKDNSRCTRW